MIQKLILFLFLIGIGVNALNDINLSGDGTFTVTWALTTNRMAIEFDVQATNITGYIALGFSTTNRAMMHLDIIALETDPAAPDGLVINDYYVTSQRQPLLDPEQNTFTILKARNVAASTARMRFRRDLDTGDANDVLIPASGVYLAWAVGNTSVLTTRHFRRGYSSTLVTFVGSTGSKLKGSAAMIQNTIILLTLFRFQ